MWRYARFHSSVLLAWLALGVLLGLLGALWVAVKIPAWAVTPVALVLVGSFRSRRVWSIGLVVICGLMLGVWRGGNFAGDVGQLAEYENTRHSFSGVVSQDPTNDELPNVWQTQLGNITIGGQKFTGEIYATILSEQPLQRGDTVSATGTFREGFGSFVLTVRRADLDRLEPGGDKFLAFRNSFGDAVKKVVPEPEASLGLGFLVGQKSSLEPDFQDQLRVVGLTHIIVASGYNLTVLVRFSRRKLAKHSRYMALAGSLGLVAVFVAISGLSPSMNRAAVVTVLSLLAWYFGRTFHPIKLILYVAASSAFMYPTYLWNDLGWLLSFAAFFGVLVLSPLIMSAVDRNKPTEPDDDKPLIRLVIETSSAQIMTLPIIAVVFGNISVVSLLANMLVAPVVPFAMGLTAFAGLVSWVTGWVWLATPASLVIAYVVSVVESLAGLSWASVQFKMSVTLAFILYLVVAAWVTALWYRNRRILEKASVVI